MAMLVAMANGGRSAPDAPSAPSVRARTTKPLASVEITGDVVDCRGVHFHERRKARADHYTALHRLSSEQTAVRSDHSQLRREDSWLSCRAARMVSWMGPDASTRVES
jgi:hypothetical protein